MHVLKSPINVYSGLLIKFKGLYDYTGLYRFMRGWLQKNMYEVQEDRYKDKYFTAFGTEIEPKWSAIRRINEYIMYSVKVEFHLWDAKDVEVVENGEKKVMTTGRMTISLSAEVILDYAKIFDEKKGKFVAFLGDAYKKLRWREIDATYVQGLEDEVNIFQKEIQNYLNMHGKEDAYY
jgi:hypothetical protein